MQLVYTDASEQTIQATLDEGEQLANHAGPAVIFVPTDPGNAEYQAILASGEPIAPYVPPPEPEPTPLTLNAHPEGEMDATTKGYTDTLFATLVARVEALERGK